MPRLPKSTQPIKKKKVNGYKLPEKLPVGEILRDTWKNEWILGPSIGKGGFGEIYAARENNEKKKDVFEYAIKIEPHENGPLFVEKNVYIRIAKPEDVDSWKQIKNLKTLGIPTYHGSGSHTYNDTLYRFMVMKRYGQDLWNLFLNNNKQFPPATIYRCALQIIDALNYIHEKDYVHGDIKGANLLLGYTKGTENQIFLVDFGLASKFNTKEFKKDPKQAHNGTIEYTSCDWHEGVPTRRGDFEILGYNLLQWFTSTLPWEKDIANKEKVHEKKRSFMSNISENLNKHFSGVPKVFCDYFEYVSKLKFDECPNYNFCKDLFINELKRIKAPNSGQLEFTIRKKHKLKDEEISLDTKENDDIPLKKNKTDKTRAVTVQKKKNNPGTSKKTNPNITPKKNQLLSECTSKNETPQNITIESDKDIFFTPDEIATPGSISTTSVKKETPKSKRPSTKKTTNKASWRDAPTIKAGNLENQAGVYRRQSPRTKPTK